MIYLDHAATTPMLDSARQAMLEWMQPEKIGNPGSVHQNGKQAREAVELARKRVAHLIGAKPEEIIFTSGATESNALYRRLWMTVATSAAEHSSNHRPSEKTIPVNHAGLVEEKTLDEFLTNDSEIEVVSAIFVNNETGAINNIRRLANVAYRHGVLFHTDAAQALGHTEVDVDASKIDLMTIASHKLGGPMGVGALYVRKGLKDEISPMFYGGHQEFGLRPGTENVPAIAGFGAAANDAMKSLGRRREHFSKLYEAFTKTLQANMDRPFFLNGERGRNANFVENIMSIHIPGIQGESLILMLDTRDICVSAGSACNADSKTVSKTLLAMGLDETEAAQTIRVSTGFSTTEDEVIEAAKAIADACKIIAKF